MIVIMLQGRLGNQLFQYSFARNLQQKFYREEQIVINKENLKKSGSKEEGWVDSLVDFNVINYKYTKKEEINYLQKIILYLYLIFRRIIRTILRMGLDSKEIDVFFSRFLNYFGIYCINTGYCEFKKSKFKNKIIIGCFECSKYFDENRNLILKEFTPKYPLIDTNKELYKVIRETESVCITIRRGDFLKEEFKKAHYICTEDYFYKGIEIIKEKVKNPVYIFFSDDINWVKENIHIDGEVYYESGNDPVWEKLRLMSKCKHFVISNSTFSWWAQYLSQNDDKIVIAPSKWNNEIRNKDIYQDNWTIIDV